MRSLEMRELRLTYDGLGSGDVRRKDIECQLMKKVKVRLLAYKGVFDNIFSAAEVHKAKVDGTLPKGYSVHHIIPLCTKEATYDMKNMVVTEDMAHKILHDAIYSPILCKCKDGESCCILIPDIDTEKILTQADILPFIISWDENEKRMGRKGYKIGMMKNLREKSR